MLTNFDIHDRCSGQGILNPPKDVGSTSMSVMDTARLLTNGTVPKGAFPPPSDRLQRGQVHFAVLTGECDLANASALVLLNPRDTMITRVIDSHLTVAGIDRETMLIAKECIARFILTADRVGIFA